MNLNRLRTSSLAKALLLLSILSCCNGCITASLATLGTIVGFAASAASTGSDVYKLGKLDTALFANYDDSRWAVRAASADLRLKILYDRLDDPKDNDVWVMELSDEKKKTIDVRVERLTPTLCKMRVDVGFFGYEPTARVLLQQIRRHLPAAAQFDPAMEKG